MQQTKFQWQHCVVHKNRWKLYIGFATCWITRICHRKLAKTRLLFFQSEIPTHHVGKRANYGFCGLVSLAQNIFIFSQLLCILRSCWNYGTNALIRIVSGGTAIWTVRWWYIQRWAWGGCAPPPDGVATLGSRSGGVQKHKGPPVIAPKNGKFFEFALDRMRF
jgi:hypothetical protein